MEPKERRGHLPGAREVKGLEIQKERDVGKALWETEPPSPLNPPTPLPAAQPREVQGSMDMAPMTPSCPLPGMLRGKARPARVALTLCPFLLCLPGHKTREAPYSTIEPHLQEHCSSTPPSLTYCFSGFLLYLKRKCSHPLVPKMEWFQEPPRILKSKNVQIPYIKWPRRINTTVPLYLRVSHSRIQPNTEGNLAGCLYRRDIHG